MILQNLNYTRKILIDLYISESIVFQKGFFGRSMRYIYREHKNANRIYLLAKKLYFFGYPFAGEQFNIGVVFYLKSKVETFFY